MKRVRQDMDAAQRLYEQAIEADPKDANILGNFAVFMHTVRQDMDAAQRLYAQAIEADPHDANVWVNFTGFSLAVGRTTEGVEAIDRAFALAPPSTSALELRFYEYAHIAERREKAARQMEELLAQNVRSPGFDLSANVTRAIADGHPDIARLAAFVERIGSKPAPLSS